MGTNVVTGLNLGKVNQLINDAQKGIWKSAEVPELWDGKTALRVVEFLENKF